MRAVLLLALLTGPAFGQRYTLNFRTAPDAGKSVLVREEMRQEADTWVKDAGAKEIKRERVVLGEVAEYTLAVEMAKGGVPVKFTHEYTKAESSRGAKRQALPWQGRKVAFELASGRLLATPVGKALHAYDTRALEKAVGSRFIDTVRPLLPGKPVMVGDSWAVPARKAAAGLKVPFDETASLASGKLLRVYRKDGVEFAVVELKAALALKVVGGKLEYKVRVDAAIDGKSTRGHYRADLTISGMKPVDVKGEKLTTGGTTRGTVTLEVSEQAAPR